MQHRFPFRNRSSVADRACHSIDPPPLNCWSNTADLHTKQEAVRSLTPAGPSQRLVLSSSFKHIAACGCVWDGLLHEYTSNRVAQDIEGSCERKAQLVSPKSGQQSRVHMASRDAPSSPAADDASPPLKRLRTAHDGQSSDQAGASPQAGASCVSVCYSGMHSRVHRAACHSHRLFRSCPFLRGRLAHLCCNSSHLLYP